MSKTKPYDRDKPYNNLPILPPPDEKVITIEVLQSLNKANAVAELGQFQNQSFHIHREHFS